MKIEPSAEWTLPRVENWTRGVVIGSVSTNAAPSGPIAVTASSHTTIAPVSDDRA